MMSRILPLSDGGLVRMVEAGSGDPVLLVHGVGLRAEAWGPQIAALSQHSHIVAVDMPGHGESSHLPQTALLPDYVAWMARVIRALGLGPVSLAGHSMGALIAAGTAIEHPDLIRRVALLNPVHRRTPEARAAVLARADDIARGLGDPEAPLSRWFGDGPSEVRDTVAGWLRAVDMAGYATAYRAFAEGDATYADRLASIRCPALILTGSDDANSTPAMARAIAASIPSSEVVVVPGHRHMVGLTAPETVSAALVRWLATRKVHA